MKKTLLTAAVAVSMAVCANAQSNLGVAFAFELGDPYIDIENGDVIINDNIIEESDPGYIYELPCYLAFTNNNTSAKTLSMTVDVASNSMAYGEAQVCAWNCNPAPCTVSVTVPAGETVKGIGFHINYIITAPNWGEVDIDDPKWDGVWEGAVKVQMGGDELNFTLRLIKSSAGGVEGVAVDNDNTPARYFDLQGRPVAEPANGNLYIELRGNKARKVIL